MDDAGEEFNIPIEARRFTVDEFYSMIRHGIVSRDERLELIEGIILRKRHIDDPHAASVDRLTELFVNRTKAFAITRVQGHIRIGADSVPQPDLMLLKRREDYYALAVPTPADVLLVVEVSSTGLKDNRGAKADLYARSGIAELWLVNLDAEVIEVLTQPSSKGYKKTLTFQHGETVVATSLPDLRLTVDEILIEGYKKTLTFQHGETVVATSLPDLRLTVDEILIEL